MACPNCNTSENHVTSDEEYIWYCHKCTRYELRRIESVRPMTQELKSNQLKQGQVMIESICECGKAFKQWESSSHVLCPTCRNREQVKRWKENNPERYAELKEKYTEQEIARRGKYEPRMIICPDCKKEFVTNNEMEYAAVLWALNKAVDGDIILTDSQLVVNQVAGKWKVKEPRLDTLCKLARLKMEDKDVSLEWIPREENLAGKVLDKE